MSEKRQRKEKERVYTQLSYRFLTLILKQPGNIPVEAVSMAKAKPMTIGGYHFPRKQDAIEHTRQLLGRYNVDDRIAGADDTFLFDLIPRHPNAAQKIGCGIKEFRKMYNPGHGGTECLQIIRTDGTSTDISWWKCFNAMSSDASKKKALRFAIDEQLLAFKKSEFETGSTMMCPYKNVELTFYNSHTDHAAPRTFEALTAMWLHQNGINIDDVELSDTYDNQTGQMMSSTTQIDSWQDFHRTNAKLRLISPEANLSEARIALWDLDVDSDPLFREIFR